MIKYLSLITAFMVININSIYAQNANKDMPVEITAEKTLEWHRNDKQYIATGEVIAKQGETSIYSEILTADYKENRKGKVDIWRLTAAQNVKLVSKNTTAFGDVMTYDIDKSLAIMTGTNLRLISRDQTITAKESMEYWVTDGLFSAKGKAVAVKENDKREADILNATLEEDKNGKRSIKYMEAINNVVITTPEEIITGDKAIYSTVTNIAILTGNVKITRGENTLEGNKAEVNMNTNISKIFAAPTKNSKTDDRVRGVFYPSQKK